VAFPLGRILLVGIAFLSLGTLSAQTNPAVETSRLFERAAPPTGGMVNPDGMALPEGEGTTSEDESFGAQEILKTQPKPLDFTIGGSVSDFYANNVALTGSNINNGKIVTGLGPSAADVFTNHPHYTGFGGDATTTGTFAGKGAVTHPLSGAPGY
jgi:hypothetical protein